MAKKPIGVKIYSIALMLFGLYGFLSIILAVFSKQNLNTNQQISAYSPLFYLIQLIVGINLIRLKNWARLGSIFLYFIGIIFVISTFFTTSIKTNITTVLIWPLFCLSFVVFFASAIYYLSRKRTKEKFNV